MKLKTMLTGHVLTPDGKGGWIQHYGWYHKKIIYPCIFTHTYDHVKVFLFKRIIDHYHVECESLFKRCK